MKMEETKRHLERLGVSRKPSGLARYGLTSLGCVYDTKGDRVLELRIKNGRLIIYGANGANTVVIEGSINLGVDKITLHGYHNVEVSRKNPLAGEEGLPGVCACGCQEILEDGTVVPR